MKKILLLDPNFSADPISDVLLANGFEVFRLGLSNNRNRRKKFESFLNFDYSDLNRVVKIYNTKNIFQLIPGCTDLSFKIAQKVGLNLGLANYKARYNLEHLYNKKNLYKFLNNNELPHPYTILDSDLNLINKTNINSWILKPSVGFSGNRILKIKSKEFLEFDDFFLKSYKNDGFILQEFLEGPLYSYSGILMNNKIMMDAIVFEDCTNDNWRVNFSYLDNLFPKIYKNELKKISERISQLSQKKSGLIHLQFILTKFGPKIIEVIERMPGDLYSELISFSGIKGYVEGYLSNYITLKDVNKTLNNTYKTVVRVTTLYSNLIKFKQKNKHNIEIINFYHADRHNFDNSNKFQQIVVFLKFDSPEDLKEWKNSESFKILVDRN